MKECVKSYGSLIGVSECQGLASSTRSTPSAVQCHVAIRHVRHVAATTEELHHILAGAGHPSPADYSAGAVKFLDKMELANELIPAILEVALAGQTLITSVLPEEFSGG